MNEEAYVPLPPEDASRWDDAGGGPEAAPPDSRGLEDRIDQLEAALGAALSTLARQESLLSTTGYAQQVAQELGRPDGAAALAQELSAVPGLTEAVTRFPILGDMAKAWAAQKLAGAGPSGAAPLPTSLVGSQGQGSAPTGRQKQLAGDLQKMAAELGISLEDQDAMEVYADV